LAGYPVYPTVTPIIRRSFQQETVVNAVIAMPISEPGRTAKYAHIVKTSKGAEWQIDRDLLQNRSFDFSQKFLPDGLSLVDRVQSLAADEARFLSQIQGRTYANMFGLVERFISAKMLERGRAHALGDQLALEGLVRFSNEEIKHQELFRRMEQMIGANMPAGYVLVADPNEVARAVLAASTWSVLALTCHIELFVQSHYDASIKSQAELCPLFKDVFKFHWKDECRHVMLDELEWATEHAMLAETERDQAVNDLIALVAAVDGILQAQAMADAGYFIRNTRRTFAPEEVITVEATLLAAYRWQYIISGVQHPHFSRLLTDMTTPAQLATIQTALAPIMNS
jgi:hypothetical protein